MFVLSYDRYIRVKKEGREGGGSRRRRVEKADGREGGGSRGRRVEKAEGREGELSERSANKKMSFRSKSAMNRAKSLRAKTSKRLGRRMHLSE
jgi:hypothetical protein